jgi:hypothetical protein
MVSIEIISSCPNLEPSSEVLSDTTGNESNQNISFLFIPKLNLYQNALFKQK